MQRIWLSTLLLCLILQHSAGAQTPIDAANPEWNFRYDLFQLLLQQSGLRTEKNIVAAIAAPRDSVIVLIGNMDRMKVTDRTDLRNFVDRGGKLMLAIDGSFRSADFGSILPGPAKTSVPELQFQGYDDCIRITDFAKNQPITDGITEVVTNRTGWIESQSKRMTWDDLLFLPDNISGLSLQKNNRSLPLPLGKKPLLSIGYSQRSDDGLVVLCADPSMFSNGMLWYANNIELAAAIVNELASENRRSFTMFVDGKVQSQFTLPPPEKSMPSPPPTPSPPPSSLPSEPTSPRIDSLLQVANAAIKEVADPKLINEQLRNQPRGMSLEDYSRWVWGTLALLAVGLTLWQLCRRSTWFAPFASTRRMKTARDMLNASRPFDLQNKIASEALAREFCRLWSGRETEFEWRAYLDHLKHSGEDRLSPREKATVESIMAIAIFGGKSTMGDVELEQLGRSMSDLLSRFRPVAELV